MDILTFTPKTNVIIHHQSIKIVIVIIVIPVNCYLLDSVLLILLIHLQIFVSLKLISLSKSLIFEMHEAWGMSDEWRISCIGLFFVTMFNGHQLVGMFRYQSFLCALMTVIMLARGMLCFCKVQWPLQSSIAKLHGLADLAAVGLQNLKILGDATLSMVKNAKGTAEALRKARSEEESNRVKEVERLQKQEARRWRGGWLSVRYENQSISSSHYHYYHCNPLLSLRSFFACWCSTSSTSFGNFGQTHSCLTARSKSVSDWLKLQCRVSFELWECVFFTLFIPHIESETGWVCSV